MKSRFERFVQMAKEEFGLTVTQTSEEEKLTFERLFHTMPEDIARYELPYDLVEELVGYYDGAIVGESLVAGDQSNKFDVNSILTLAA